MEQDSRSRLLENSVALFACKGLHGVSIRQLSDAAGVNSALISYHFGSKEGLYAAVLERQFSAIANSLAKLPAPHANAETKLAFYAEVVLNAHRLQPYLIRFLHNELSNPTACFESILKKYIKKFYHFLQTTLADGIAAGEFKSDLDPAYAALSLVGTLNFYFIAKPLAASFFPADPDQDAHYVQQALGIYLSGIRRENHG